MNSVKTVVLIVCALVLAGPVFAVPQYLNYQGVLRDNSGNLVTGSKEMTFRVYDAVTAGTKQFEMTTTEVVSNGLYTAQLGPIGYSELGSGRRWLEVTVGTEILTPRLEVLTVAYAVTAGNSDYATLSGTASTAATATTATNANTVNGISAATTATASQLLALDANTQFKGASISAEAAGNTYGLYVGSGKIGIKTGTNMSAGTGTITNGTNNTQINTTAVTANSLIFITSTLRNATAYESLVAYNIVAGTSFNVGIAKTTTTAPADINFNYLIIN